MTRPGVVALAALGALAMVSSRQPPTRAGDQSARDRLERAYRESNTGVAFLEQYDYPAAVQAFRRALQIEPTLPAAHLDLAIALLYAGQTSAALPEAQSAEKALPDAPEPPFVLGLIARADNRTEDAEAAFRRVLTIDASDAASNVNLGQLLLQKREYDGSVKAFRAAVAAEPYNATAAYGLAMALMRSGDTAAGQQAMAAFQKLRDSQYAVTYAQGYLQQGRYGEALASTGAEPGLVDTASPQVRFAAVDDAIPTVAPAGVRGALLVDADADGDLDLLVIDSGGARLLRNDGARFSATTVVPRSPEDADETVATAGDYDNDGHADIFVAGPRTGRLLHQRADGSFEDVTRSAGIPPGTSASAASWVDVDHDGDLDLVTADPIRLFRNNGTGTFTDITAAAGVSVSAGDRAAPAAIVPTDYDNRRDVDLLILSGGALHLFRNMRDGTFQDVAGSVGLPPSAGLTSLTAADFNKDGFIDFFFGRANAAGVFAMSDGRGRFVITDGPAETADARQAAYLDYDNDGLLDLFVGTSSGVRVLRNIGTGWVDETAHVGLGPGQVTAVALGDVDRDGDTDAVLVDGRSSPRLWRNDGGNRNHAIAVSLAPRVSNHGGFGAKVEIRAGSLRQMLETSAASPAVGPVDLLFGLGSRDAADVVRVLWPSGILQSEIAPKSPARIEELDRKPSSCPYLYTWNGRRFVFVTDFLGGGEMGDWEAPGRFDSPDPDEYVRIPDGLLQPRNGRYELRVTNELEEAMFLDRVQLVAVDHPADTDVYPNEGLKEPPRPPSRIYTVRDARAPERAIDDRGHDVRDLIAARDRRWPADFDRLRFGGYAAPHALTFDLGRDAEDAVLLLTGWTEYAFSTDNVAASQAGLTLQAPALQVKKRSGEWTTIDTNVGFPVGRPQTVVLDMAGRWLGPSREVRITTSMPIYWDQVLVAHPDSRTPVVSTRLDAASAVLRWRGYSAETSPDGRGPFGADYESVSAAAPWKTFPGAYTRVGDVGELLHRVDDMFVVSKPGDEIALSFDASALPPLRQGWKRSFLLFADGFSKEMNIRSATPDVLGPLPFHAMSRYPYGPGEHYPDDEAHREYQARYNTRVVSRVVPTIDVSAATSGSRKP